MAHQDTKTHARSAADRAPVRVLQLLHMNEAGGVEVLADMIARGLTADGARVETLFLYPARDIGAIGKLRGTFAGIRAVLGGRPDVLITYQSTASLISATFGQLVGCRLRIVHQTALPGEINWVNRGLDRIAGTLGLYSVNVANSSATLRAFAGYPARYRRSLRHIDHGLSVPMPLETAHAVRQRYRLPVDRPLLFSAGRLSDQKAHWRAVAALADLPDAHLAIAGGGPLEAALRSQAQRLGVTDRLQLLGYRTRQEVIDLYGAADVFVFPSAWETFGFAGVEAAMVGTPVVASDLEVLREVLTVDGETVATFVPAAAGAGADTQGAREAADGARWAAAIKRCLADPKNRAKAQRFAVRLREKYAEQRMVEAYVRLLRTTTSGVSRLN